MSKQRWPQRLLFVPILLMSVVMAWQLSSAEAATSSERSAAGLCDAFPRFVDEEAGLADALTCFNTISDPGRYEVMLTTSISLTADLPVLRNANAGVALAMDGSGFTLDGQDSVRSGLAISPTTRITLTNITLINGNAETGGAIVNEGQLTVMSSTIANNVAFGDGGGIADDGRLRVIGSTLNGNSTTGFGGGIASGGDVVIINSTISGNSADEGGGIVSAGTLSVTHSTINANSAILSGGGIFMTSVFTGELSLESTIIANSVGGDCVLSSDSRLVYNAFNFIESSRQACGILPGGGTTVGGVALLEPLADNFGPTQTHALQDNSPAIDSANPNCMADFDQRGIGRPQGERCDIGAVERLTTPLAVGLGQMSAESGYRWGILTTLLLACGLTGFVVRASRRER